MRSLLTKAGVLLVLAAFCVARDAHAQAGFADPMDVAAIAVPNPDQQPLIAITPAGGHMVAVGSRGLIIYSDAATKNWTQAPSPVQSDLVAVSFVDASNGWACGHDGVILHTVDGGKTWSEQLNGITAQRSFESYYTQQIAAANGAKPANTALAGSLGSALQQVQANFDPGPILPWMGVAFLDQNTGFVVGPFGDLAHTADGGKTWTPWLDHIDNPNFYDLNAIGMAGSNLYIIGEQGSVYIFDPKQQKFIARPTSYAGSLFGMAGDDKTLVVYGLRGNIFRSEDQGKTWMPSKDPSTSSIMDGVELPNGHFVLVTVDGIELISIDDGASFQASSTVQDQPLSGIAAAGSGLVMTSLGGIRHAPGA